MNFPPVNVARRIDNKKSTSKPINMLNFPAILIIRIILIESNGVMKEW